MYFIHILYTYAVLWFWFSQDCTVRNICPRISTLNNTAAPLNDPAKPPTKTRNDKATFPRQTRDDPAQPISP